MNNSYGWTIPQKLLVTSEFNKYFIKNYNKDGHIGYFVEVDVKYSEQLHETHNDLTFLRERIEIEKLQKLVCDLNDKKEYISLKQALHHGLVFQKVYRVIKFHQKSWLKPYTDMNIELR